MPRLRILIAPFILLLIIALGAGCQAATKFKITQTINQNMQITSSAFLNEGQLPSKYSCDSFDPAQSRPEHLSKGDSAGINPPLTISGAPTGTKSFALIVRDPDAVSGEFIHWTVWNIPTSTTNIFENSAPGGATEGATSLGKPGFVPPCPPSGSHRYYFTVYALDIILNLTSKTNAADLEQAMNGHILASGEIMARYERAKR